MKCCQAIVTRTSSPAHIMGSDNGRGRLVTHTHRGLPPFRMDQLARVTVSISLSWAVKLPVDAPLTLSAAGFYRT